MGMKIFSVMGCGTENGGTPSGQVKPPLTAVATRLTAKLQGLFCPSLRRLWASVPGVWGRLLQVPYPPMAPTPAKMGALRLSFPEVLSYSFSGSYES